ncbi:MAG: zinc dependent phospholipase C family protein, partial [Bacteroidota bacterium]
LCRCSAGSPRVCWHSAACRDLRHDRRINRLAVFTLPSDMLYFYKSQIDYLTDHAVDPDKRRYASKHEAIRHYIDIDHWGEMPFREVPRSWNDVLIQYTSLDIVRSIGDTLSLQFRNWEGPFRDSTDFTRIADSLQLSHQRLQKLGSQYEKWFLAKIKPQYYEDEWTLDCEEIRFLLDDLGLDMDCQSVLATDHFSSYGILPYHLVQMQKRLTKAFEQRDAKRVLQLSADFGHYIGDAHVPLHTTENYNGQLTNQLGIHAFWESRIPELFADQRFDYFVGKAQYIRNPEEFYWDIVLSSHALVDSVLGIEQDLRLRFPIDQQMCYDNRLERTILTQCKEFADAYDRRMKGMVENRMRGAILAIGSAWMTAWYDAGQPDLRELDASGWLESVRKKRDREGQERGKIKGRQHEG